MHNTARSLMRPIVSAALTLTLVGAFVAFDSAGSAAHAASPHAATAVTIPKTAPAALPDAPDDWFTSWAQSQDRRSGITFTNQTFRMITHLSQGGDSLRIRLQNQFGAAPITVEAAAVALSSTGAATVAGTSRALTFAGQASVVLPIGGGVWSDPVELETKAQDDVAVSMYFNAPMVPSLHSSPYRNNYISATDSGNLITDTTGEAFAGTDLMPWTYFVTAVDVHNTELNGTIVAYGSSVVDGEGSQDCGPDCRATGTDRRWSDDLARRINSELPADAQVAVANEGIGGTTASPVCAGGGNDGVNRLNRDVLALHGVTAVIYYYGTNDLPANCGAETILASYQDVFQRLRDAGIKIFVTPITPRPSYTAPQNAVRSTVNDFVRAGGNCSGTCDGVFDFDTVLKDPANSNSVYPPYDHGDGVHANVTGQQAIANSIPLQTLAATGLAPGAPTPSLKEFTKYDFEDGFQGWRVGSGIGSVQWKTSFANGPKTPFAGERVMDAFPANIAADELKSLYVEPAEPLDLRGSKALNAHIDSYGALVGATGYEASVTLTGADDDVLTQTFPMTPDQWNELSLDISEWSARSAVSKIEVGFRALGTSTIWQPHFQIDEITWDATPDITSEIPPAATIGSPYSFTITATGHPAPTFAVSNGSLPEGLSLDATTGIISGTPTTAESAAFTITASNGIGEDATAEYDMTVESVAVEPTDPADPSEPGDSTDPIVQPMPSVSTVSNTTAEEGSSNSLAKTGSDLMPFGALSALVLLLGCGLVLLRSREQAGSTQRRK